MPFQLYTPGIIETAHLLIPICQWPADIREFAATPKHKLMFRTLGYIDRRILPIEFSALERLGELEIGPFLVVITTSATRDAVTAILKRIDRPILHVSDEPCEGVVSIDDVSIGLLSDFTKKVIANIDPSDGFRQAAEEVLAEEIDKTLMTPCCATYSHGVTAANEAALLAFNYAAGAKAPLDGKGRDHLIEAMLTSASAVRQARSDLLNTHLAKRVRNCYILTATSPAWVFSSSTPDFSRIENSEKRRVLKILLTGIKRQREFITHLTLPTGLEPDHPLIQMTMAHRSAETRAYVAGLAALSSQDLTPVLRLEPKVNEIRSRLIQLGACARGAGPHRQFKLQKLFTSLSNDLNERVDPRVLALLLEPTERVEGVKLISDLPLEFLSIDNWPLSLRYDCSRIPVTPGSLSIGQLLYSPQQILSSSSFAEILVVRSFDDSDPCRPLLERAIRQIQEEMGIKVAFRIVDVNTATEFVETLNSFDGSMAIFDCHGHRDHQDHSGTIVIGGQPLHLWQYRTEIRVPPIVLFSACDTLPLDGSHGSSSVGMLLLGARSVLGTLLPVDARTEAVFVARLALRVAQFLPLVLRHRRDGIDWRSFLGGMLRMGHVSEVLHPLLTSKMITRAQRDDIQLHANMEINSGNPDWLTSVEERVCQFIGNRGKGILNKLTDALLHVQLGSPEHLLIVDRMPGDIVTDTLSRLESTSS